MREEHPINEVPTPEHRITPACAGRTDTELTFQEICEDHPRVCGKNFHNIKRVVINLGSPPRVREELIGSNHGIKAVGITPACAGRT